MGIDPSRMTHMKTFFIGIEGSLVPVKGAWKISVMISTYSRYITLQQTFMMIDIALAYNAIIRRPLMHQINAIISIGYVILKFTTQKGWLL